MSQTVAFLVSPPCHLGALEQLDSPETVEEGVGSPPALLAAFPQSRGKDGAKVVFVLRVFR